MSNQFSKLSKRLLKQSYRSLKKAAKQKQTQKRQVQAPTSAYSAGVEVVRIESGGKLRIPVYGEQYGQGSSQTTLAKLKKSGAREFSITPPHQYQIQNRWPEPPFANVNIYGSLITSRANWLGYIAPGYNADTTERQERQVYINKLIELAKIVPLTVTGQIIDEDGTFQLIIYASRSSVDEAYRRYIG